MQQKREEKIPLTVGPGQYETKIFTSNSVTIGKRHAEKKEEEFPAPGDYDLKSHILEGPSHSIGVKHD